MQIWSSEERSRWYLEIPKQVWIETRTKQSFLDSPALRGHRERKRNHLKRLRSDQGGTGWVAVTNKRVWHSRSQVKKIGHGRGNDHLSR